MQPLIGDLARSPSLFLRGIPDGFEVWTLAVEHFRAAIALYEDLAVLAVDHRSPLI
jgi:hypothetical protein